MKVQSIISFFALYLVSGLNAQAQNDPSSYLDEDTSELTPVQAFSGTNARIGRQAQPQASSARAAVSRMPQQGGRAGKLASSQQRVMGAARGRPVSKAAIGQRPGNGSKQQVPGKLPTSSRGGQKTLQSSRANQGQQSQQKGRVARPAGNQQRVMGAARSRPVSRATGGPAQARNRPAGKITVGGKTAVGAKFAVGGKAAAGGKSVKSAKQESNFDSLDNTQGNQEPSSQTTISQKPGTAPKVQAEPTSPNNNQSNQGSNSQTTVSQKPGVAPKVQAQPNTPSNTQGNQGPNGQPQGGLNKSADDSMATGACRKIRAVPKMDIVKLLTDINKVRGDLNPLKISPALIKASVLKASSSTDNKKASNSGTGKALLSHSKECGYKGKNAIHYTSVAKDENDLFNKLKSQVDNMSKLKDAKYKAFGAAKVGTKFVLTFGQE